MAVHELSYNGKVKGDPGPREEGISIGKGESSGLRAMGASVGPTTKGLRVAKIRASCTLAFFACTSVRSEIKG